MLQLSFSQLVMFNVLVVVGDQHVPEGDWFCPSCRPKEVVHVPRTPRKSFFAPEDSDADATDDENDANDSRLVFYTNEFIILRFS